MVLLPAVIYFLGQTSSSNRIAVSDRYGIVAARDFILDAREGFVWSREYDGGNVWTGKLIVEPQSSVKYPLSLEAWHGSRQKLKEKK